MMIAPIVSALSNTFFLGMVVGIPGYALMRGVKVYESFISGAKEGLEITWNIIPHLVAMIVAIGMLRASGAFAYVSSSLAGVLTWLHFPPDLLPLALVRSFSGSASNAVLVDVIHTHGANSYLANLAATMAGGTDTTFYVLAIYFGSVQVMRTRHAIPSGLFADVVSAFAALFFCYWLL